MGENSLDHDGYSAKREMRRPEGIYTVRLAGGLHPTMMIFSSGDAAGHVSWIQSGRFLRTNMGLVRVADRLRAFWYGNVP